MTTNDLAKETLVELKNRGLKATPENYTEVFEELAAKNGMSVGTREKINKFKALLIPSQQDDLKLSKMKNIDEFLSFLISKLNRAGKQNDETFFVLLSAILQALQVSFDKKVAEMSAATLEKINKNLDPENAFLVEKKWDEWRKNYKDDKNYEKALLDFGVKGEDFVGVIKRLISELKVRSYERFAGLIALCLQPSLSENESLKGWEKKLLQTPAKLALKDGRDEFKNELASMVNKRVSTDLIFIQNQINFFDENLKKLSKMLDNMNEMSAKNADFVQKLPQKDGKVELKFDELKARFDAISEKISAFSKQVVVMADKKERDDYSIAKRIARLDAEFLKSGTNYALCAFSVKNYAFIVEKYGLKNLDEILGRFKKILMNNCGIYDELWMLDERSYLVISLDRDYENMLKFAEKNAAQMENFKFIYKDEIINPRTISVFMDKQSFPHLNLLDEIMKNLDEI